MHLVDSHFPRRSRIRRVQANHFATLLVDLLREIQRTGLGAEDQERFFKMPEYERLISGAYATGWVCSDLHASADLEQIASQPEGLREYDLGKLRRYIHTLIRAERHNHPWSSPILAASLAGALAQVVQRLNAESNPRV